MHPGIVEAKRALRAEIRSARAARGRTDGEHVGSMADAFLAVAQAAGLLDPSRRSGAIGTVVLGAYLAMPGEPDPVLLCQRVRSVDGRVLLPRPIPGRGLEWALDDGTRGAAEAPVRVPVPTGQTAGVGAAALLEAGATALLLPALAVDVQGRRLGQGGGYYDRLLADLAAARTAGRRAPLLVAMVHDEEVLAAGRIPMEEHDQRVEAALTPSGLQVFP